LGHIGYGVALAHDALSGAPLDPESHYHFRADRGPWLAVAETRATYPGSSLASLASEELGDAQCLRDARRLLRDALSACLEGRNLRSREVLAALRQHEVKA
jgi:DNA repair protein RecO (recombination protein O)